MVNCYLKIILSFMHKHSWRGNRSIMDNLMCPILLKNYLCFIPFYWRFGRYFKNIRISAKCNTKFTFLTILWFYFFNELTQSNIFESSNTSDIFAFDVDIKSPIGSFLPNIWYYAFIKFNLCIPFNKQHKAFAMVFSITHRCVNFTKAGFCSMSRYLLRKSPQVICPVTICGITDKGIDIVKLNAEIEEIVARQQVLRDEIAKIIAEIEVWLWQMNWQFTNRLLMM